MRLDRKLIKEQAKQLIKGNIWKLLLITIVVSALVGTTSFSTGFGDGYRHGFNSNGKSEQEIEDSVEDWLEDFGFKFDDNKNDNQNENSNSNDNQDGFDPNHFDDFTGKVSLIPTSVHVYDIFGQPIRTSGFHGNITIISLIALPLTVTLWGIYLSLVRGKCLSVGESFSYVFGRTFNRTYGRKLGLVLLMWIFTFLWALLLVIPGIVYAYKVRFAPMIMEEHPDLTVKEALELSKKMTNDHKGELFSLDVSFIPWAILCVITFGIASIYFIPYKMTVDALYYVNFKARCEQEGRILPEEYMGMAKRMESYGAPAQQPPYSQAPYGSEYQRVDMNNQQPGYYQPQQQDTGYYQPPQQTSYYEPAKPEAPSYYPPTAPQQPVYNQSQATEQNYYQPVTPPPAPEHKPDDFGTSMGSDYFNNQSF